MQNEYAIQCKSVSKKLCKNPSSSIIYGLTDITKSIFGTKINSNILRKNEFWVLQDITFHIKQGESLAILGSNGAGKTTLLKMISGLMLPDSGSITVRGKVSPLIELTAGFQPALTGLENIYINGTILGMHKKEIDLKLDKIVSFADIGDFINAPVRIYSSGMIARLGFSIAVHTEPDILLIDEVLAVGDRNFQIKCFQKIHELKKKNNLTFILVSHNELSIREYTQHAIVINKGRLLFFGNSEKAYSFYINHVVNTSHEYTLANNKIVNSQYIKNLIIRNEKGKITNILKTGEKVTIDILFDFKLEIKKPIFEINLYYSEGLFVSVSSAQQGVVFPDLSGKGIVRIVLNPFDVPVGKYTGDIALYSEEESNLIDWRDLQTQIQVEKASNTLGLVKLSQKWELVQ